MLTLHAFLADEAGSTAIEYALLALLVTAGLILSIRTIATVLNTTFQDVIVGFSGAGS